MSSEFRKVKLKDIASFKYGKTIRKQDIQSCGEYPVFSGYQVVGYLPGYMYKEEQLIIVCRGAGGTGDIKMSPSFCSITNLAI
ncbi:restriction endonuclease subunit S, partial [Salmonella enterica]|nr:restriction endonuclease subunit S [Salmonella enterica]